MERGFLIEKLNSAKVYQNEKPQALKNGEDSFLITIVNSGKLLVTLSEEVYECAQGTAAIVPCNNMKSLKLINDVYCEYTLLSFEVSGFACQNAEPKAVNLSVFQKQLALDIANQILQNGGYDENSVAEEDIKFAKLLSSAELMAINLLESNQNLIPLETRDTSLFKTATEKIKENLYGNTSVEDLANELGISLSHIKRIFAAFCDVGVHEYAMALKIIKAKELLKNGTSVTETAEIMGFNNQNYFSQAFKRITGITPKEFSGSKRKTEPKVVKEKTVSKPAATKTNRSDMPNYLL